MTRNKKTRSAAVQESQPLGSVRIIGGLWRGRRVPIETAPGLRPTPDRVRETLYNWLQGRLLGARVLDLYAGSGALGIEALSRGASAAVFVERDLRVAARLRATLAMLGAVGAEVHAADALDFLNRDVALAGGPFDGVLLDPPFANGAHADLCTLLERRRWLAAGAWVYVESASAQPPPTLPHGWSVLRTLRAGAVGALLARRGDAGGGAPPETPREPADPSKQVS